MAKIEKRLISIAKEIPLKLMNCEKKQRDYAFA